MKRFIKLITFYLIIPGLIVGIFMELLLRTIPNSYAYKKHYLDTNPDSIRVLILGGSNSYYDVNPSYLSQRSSGFNAANILQSFNVDFEILKKYNSKLTNLRWVLIPINYGSLSFRTENIELIDPGEAWRICNYIVHFGLNIPHKITDNSELLNLKFRVSSNSIASYYIFNNYDRGCSLLGWGTQSKFKEKKNLFETGKAEAKRHTFKDTPIETNLNVLKSIIDLATKDGRNTRILLFTPPAFHTYVENLDVNQLEQTIDAVSGLEKYSPQVKYLNFLTDSSFTERDFFDADHLDEYGAQKFTLKIDSIITGIENKQR